MSALEPITRPNGKLYRPRRLRTQVLGNEDEVLQIVVFGTRDVQEAESVARLDLLALTAEWFSGDYEWRLAPKPPRPIWYSKTLLSWDEIDGPSFSFHDDPEHGAGGLLFGVDEHDLGDLLATDNHEVRGGE